MPVSSTLMRSRQWATSSSSRAARIPAPAQEKIFEQFSQLDGSTKRQYGGTGLGLAICRTIIEAHGGRIDADKMPDGGGASVCFTLPKGLPPTVEEEKS
jgi:signal transduction histidine kinase